MSKYIRLQRSFTYNIGGGARRTLPAGWAGTVEDAVAQQAEKEGAVSPTDKGQAALVGAAVGSVELGGAVEAAAGAADDAGAGAGDGAGDTPEPGAPAPAPAAKPKAAAAKPAAAKPAAATTTA